MITTDETAKNRCGLPTLESMNHRFSRHVKDAQALSFEQICDSARDIAVELRIDPAGPSEERFVDVACEPIRAEDSNGSKKS